MTFLILYWWNLILDYPLQGDFLGVGKATYSYLLFVHSAIWGLGMSIALVPFGLFEWWKVVMLVVGHYGIDYLKCRKVWIMKQMHPLKEALWIDQLLHVIQICLVFIR